MAFSSTRWGSNAFFPAIERVVFLLVQEYSTCWNEKSSMTFRLGRAPHSAIGMQLIATRFHDVIVLAGAEAVGQNAVHQFAALITESDDEPIMGIFAGPP